MSDIDGIKDPYNDDPRNALNLPVDRMKSALSVSERLKEISARLSHSGYDDERGELIDIANALRDDTSRACLLEIHRTVHSWDAVPVINEHDQWTVKRVKELLLAYQAKQVFCIRCGVDLDPPEPKPRML